MNKLFIILVILFQFSFAYGQEVHPAGITIVGDSTVISTDGLDLDPGGDVDTDVVTIGVTDSPRIWWDESADLFTFTKGILAGTSIAVDNLQLSGNTISSTDTNGDIVLDPNGTGGVQFTDLTATTVPYLDASKELVSSAVTPTELGYLSGVTSSIQTQIDAAGGGSGSGSKTYFTGGDFEVDVSLATVYDDGGAFVDGSGGSPSVITISRNTTTPLEKTADLKITKSASSGSGEGVTLLTGTIDRADRGQNLYLSFEWDGSDANYTDGDYKVHGYSNGTDATILPFFPISGFNDDGTLPAYKTKVYGYFQTSSTTDSTINVSIHLASDSATGSAVSVYVDDAKIGPASLTPSAIAGRSVRYTLGANQSIPSTTATVVGYNTQDFDDYGLVTGTGTGWKYTATITGKLDVKAALLLDTSAAWNSLEEFRIGIYKNGSEYSIGKRDDNMAANSYASSVVSDVVDVVPGDYIQIVAYQVSGSAINTYAGSTLSYVSITEHTRPGAMLSTTEASIKTLRVIASNSAGDVMTTGSFSDIIYATETKDTHGAYTSGIFTAPFTGDFIFMASGQTESNTANTGEAILVLRDSSDNILYYGDRSGIDGSSTQSRQVAATLSMTKGDTAKVSFYHTNGANRALVSLASANKLTILGYPDFTHFSTYGTFELKTNTSSEKTPSGSNYHQMSNNSITLTPGTWELLPSQAVFNNNGSNPAYSFYAVSWFSANGADSGTTPAALSSATGLTVLSSTYSTEAGKMGLPVTGSNGWISSVSIIVRVTQNVTVYLVPYSAQTTSANARITVYPNAKRLQ